MLRFHWSLSSAGESLRGARSRAAQSGVPNLPAHVEFCRRAEESGIESLLVAFGSHRADPIGLVGALGMATERVKFMIACRSGVATPTYFVQQINTLSVLTGGRVCINIVAGHSPHENLYYGDDLSHDERYARSDEFWSICHGLWRGEGPVDFAGRYYRVVGAKLNTPFLAPDRAAPEIFLGGNSPQAEAMAVRHANCLLCLPDTPERMAPRIAHLRAQGIEVGLLVSQIARPTRDEALAAAQALLESAGEGARAVHQEFFRRSDSVAFTSTGRRAAEAESAWLTPTLWSGAVPYLGAPAIAFVGSAEEVAETILEYQRIGVSQFLFMGWPDDQAMTYFGREVLPRVREREDAAVCPAASAETER
jgi:alkanesulfonate monooxygenase